MSDDEKIYEAIWNSPIDDFNDSTSRLKPPPPPRNGSIRTNISETDDGLSESYKSFEGESVDNLDIPVVFKAVLGVRNEKRLNNRSLKSDAVVPFPKKPCFSELDNNDKLEYHGPITQLVHKITTNKKSRYAVLISNRLILFEKPEHKVSKTQIPLTSMTGIDWTDNANCTNKNDCNKFRVETQLRSYKFQCSSHENAGLWINHIGKLLFDKQQQQHSDDTAHAHILKASVALENVKGKRIFTVEPKYTVAYYESDDDFKWGIAMHRIQLRASGVKRDRVDADTLQLITSYRKYKLSFESVAICNEWFQALSVIIQNAISSTISSAGGRSGDDILEELCRDNAANRCCVECGAADVKWASMNLCVTLCERCAGLHRGLGPNVSKVQGIFTDETRWEDQNLLRLFHVIGNDNATRFWMANWDGEVKAVDVDRRFVVEKVDRKFIVDKYVRKKFIERRESVFEKYKDATAFSEALLECVRSDDVLRTMRLFHVGVDVTESREAALAVAQQQRQLLQVAFLQNQCQSLVKDWRSELFDGEDKEAMEMGTPFQERYLFCSINREIQREERLIQIWADGIDIAELCKIDYRNICLVREKAQGDGGGNGGDSRVTLLMVVRDTEYYASGTSNNNDISVVEFSCNEADQSNDLRDFKNVLAQKICPGFVPSRSFVCAAWTVVSTVHDDWRPALLLLNYDSIADFHDVPTQSTKRADEPRLSIDLRKVQKIEELRVGTIENACPYAVYNLASICLVSSSATSVIYHLRGDTRDAHDEIHQAINESWQARASNLLADQFLTKHNVPLPIYKMIRYLQVHGTHIEGLFRRVGAVKEADKIYRELTTNPDSYVLANCEPHDVASALKLFFRKLRDPLLTKDLYRHWMIAVDLRNSEEKRCYFKQLVKSLPKVHYETLRLLIFLLVNIDKNSDVTQMNPDNLATSFNTCLLFGVDDGDGGRESFSPRNLLVLPYLIRNYRDLFDVTQEELEMEEKYVKERKKINDSSPTETSLLRQIHIDAALETFLRKDINFERELSSPGNNNNNNNHHGNKKSNSPSKLQSSSSSPLSKQLRIEQSMTSASLQKRLFEENTVDPQNVMLFEERRIDEVPMQLLVYPQQNLIAVIHSSEMAAAAAAAADGGGESKHNNGGGKWIFKWNIYDIDVDAEVVRGRGRSSFRCAATLAVPWGRHNKIVLELTRIGHLNLWKNDQQSELLLGLSARGLALYRSCDTEKCSVAFQDCRGKSSAGGGGANLSAGLLQLFSFKARSSFIFVNFSSRVDCMEFLRCYDQWKLAELAQLVGDRHNRD